MPELNKTERAWSGIGEGGFGELGGWEGPGVRAFLLLQLPKWKGFSLSSRSGRTSNFVFLDKLIRCSKVAQGYSRHKKCQNVAKDNLLGPKTGE